MKQITLEPIASVSGEIRLPGSKSISNRALLLAAVATGTTVLSNLLDSDDVRHMLAALTSLQVKWRWLNQAQGEIEIEGNGGLLAQAEQPLELYLGNAGTAMRPLAAALTVGQGEYVLTGEERMSERPIGHQIDALRKLGAQVEYLQDDGFPPLKISGGTLHGGSVDIDGSISSQFLTALLMTAPLINQDLVINVIGDLVSKPYIDITIALMARFGVTVDNNEYQQLIVKAGQRYIAPGRFLVEGDASSASYFLAAGALGHGPVAVHGVGRLSLQGDKYFADVLAAMGATIDWHDDYIVATGAPLKGIDMDMNHIPDAAMTIATVALFAEGTTTIRNIYNWRVKETDRLAAMATELRKVGATVDEGQDYISVTPAPLQHAAIDTYNDHRMAMCFSMLAVGGQQVTINDPDCTAKTFPDYFDQLHRISN
ncbi:3-phosphoshikimate 1-carboxyvinyltransferase [Ferrimonas lipolytica]|uniref:3-phosphoshikimate 1-carboxyvinyltransferase n=1 Tax=Ferrimonas lipolytica TaxID=2724191 RepID=A0A6H1UFN8_9GAMM|nr:3-phosphoshikimate 1-carboxyvinyltransferase [Ferrimonas lipolytica]QIZ76612.1 3-phosphoshikimate 1-carboxyvinyltransferase [Ferrimonas lipolytica]